MFIVYLTRGLIVPKDSSAIPANVTLPSFNVGKGLETGHGEAEFFGRLRQEPGFGSGSWRHGIFTNLTGKF
jgi:hypothetical protein